MLIQVRPADLQVGCVGFCGCVCGCFMSSNFPIFPCVAWFDGLRHKKKKPVNFLRNSRVLHPEIGSGGWI
jgi:hypothetical protein